MKVVPHPPAGEVTKLHKNTSEKGKLLVRREPNRTDNQAHFNPTMSLQTHTVKHLETVLL